MTALSLSRIERMTIHDTRLSVRRMGLNSYLSKNLVHTAHACAQMHLHLPNASANAAFALALAFDSSAFAFALAFDTNAFD